MINDYRIRSGINKDDKEELRKLSLYLQELEQSNPNLCKQLNEIVENNPKILFEPQKIDENIKFPIRDLAFIYLSEEIIGHFLCIFGREITKFGYKTNVTIEEEYMGSSIPSNYFDEYIMNRLKGNLSLEFKVNEKNNQK